MFDQKVVADFLGNYPDGQRVLMHGATDEDLIALRIGGPKDGEFSVFAMLVNRIPPHVHRHTSHRYLIIKGSLSLDKVGEDGVPNRMPGMNKSGDNVVIVSSNEAHAAWADDGPAELLVLSFPADMEDDVYPVDDATLKKLLNGVAKRH